MCEGQGKRAQFDLLNKRRIRRGDLVKLLGPGSVCNNIIKIYMESNNRLRQSRAGLREHLPTHKMHAMPEKQLDLAWMVLNREASSQVAGSVSALFDGSYFVTKINTAYCCVNSMHLQPIYQPDGFKHGVWSRGDDYGGNLYWLICLQPGNRDQLDSVCTYCKMVCCPFTVNWEMSPDSPKQYQDTDRRHT